MLKNTPLPVLGVEFMEWPNDVINFERCPAPEKKKRLTIKKKIA